MCSIYRAQVGAELANVVVRHSRCFRSKVTKHSEIKCFSQFYRTLGFQQNKKKTYAESFTKRASHRTRQLTQPATSKHTHHHHTKGEQTSGGVSRVVVLSLHASVHCQLRFRRWCGDWADTTTTRRRMIYVYIYFMYVVYRTITPSKPSQRTVSKTDSQLYS